MSRTLVVTPYAPSRDGIAAYAAQQITAMRAEGEEVTVLSPGPSAAHYHLALAGVRGAVALAKHIRAHRYDRVVIQFHPDFFWPIGCSPRERAATAAALTVAFRLAQRVEVYLHEINVNHAKGRYGLPMRALWASADVIWVHTATERRQFIDAFSIAPDKVRVAVHGKDFQRHTELDRSAARAHLGLGEDDFVFLSIGFIQEHKGFDRAVRAFKGLPSLGPYRYAVVGSVRVDEPDFVAYRDRLAQLVERTDGAMFVDGYVTDDAFDRWIVACDVVVLPYRSIWSSGVLERARLYGRPVIATTVGGLADQAADMSSVRLVADDAELKRAMWEAAGVGLDVPVSTDWVTRLIEGDGAPAAESIQSALRARADALRAAGVVHVNDAPGTIAVRQRRTSRVGAGAVGLGDAASGTEVIGSEVIGSEAIGSASSRAGRVAAADFGPPPSAALRALPPAGLGGPASRMPGGGLVKRLIARLTRWEVQPLADQVNQLRAATTRAVESIEDRL